MEQTQDWLAAQAQVRPEGPALYLGELRLTYRELNDEVSRCAGRLAALGLQPAMRLGLLLPNGLEAVLALHAAARLGLVAVLLNTRLTPRELETLLLVAPCDLLLCARETLGLARALSIPLRLTCVDETNDPALTYLGSVAVPTPPDNDLRSRLLDLDETFALLFTSGTSGKPKGVALSYRNLYAGAMASAYRIGVLPDDRWLCVLPLFHVGGLNVIMRSCLYGTAVDLWPRFDAQAINMALGREPISLISLVPTMLHRLLEMTNPPLEPLRLRLVLLGGAAATPDLVARAQARGIAVAPTYGMTEAASQVATALPEQAARKPGSVGKPLLFTQVRVLDEDGREQPPGVYGEIVVAGPTVMQGYLGDAEANTTTLRDGWLHTGDIGYLDADGDLWVVQRRSDLIISGGENVYPAEVEQVLRTHPAVADAAVAGVDSAEWGQRVAAALVLHEPDALEMVLAFARTRLAGYKQPRLVRVVAEIPRSEGGKLRRAALLELFDADQRPRLPD